MAVLKKFGYILATIVLALGGCSLLHPKVAIAPQIMTTELDSVALSGPVTVSVYDERLQKSLGTQQVALLGERPLMLANNLSASVKSAVERALQSYGLQPGSSNESPQLQLYIDQLSYRVPDTNIMTKAYAKTSLRVVLNTGPGTKTYRRTFRAEDSSSKDDKTLINNVLEQAINKIFADPEFLKLLGA